MRLQPGTLLQGDRYRIIDVLGQGGFGITYLAEQVMAERKVCIKEFFPKEYYNRDEDSRSISLGSQGSAEIMDLYKAKFIKEAKTIAKLDHPNIIHIHDVFAENNTAYYVMEYIDGESLSALVKERGALSESEAIGYIKQVAAALDNIHEQRIMHLDIKPANIMLRKADGKPVLIDFGLSKQYDAEGNQTSSTPVGISAGYAPMEQYQQGGVKEFSPETDIYSLGATLYYLVTGSVPPQAAAIVDDGLPELPAHLSANVRNAIERSMEIQRKKRPHSTKEFVAILGDGGATPATNNRVAAAAPAPSIEDESTKFGAPVDDESTKLGGTPTSTPKAEPKKEWTPKYSTEKPKKSNDEKKKKSRWWMWLLGLLVVGVVLFTLGGNEENLKSGESTQNIKTYKVGDYYNENGKEGVVFAVSDGGRHGKIVSLDQTKAPWDSRVEWTGSEFINGTETGANDEHNGKANTNTIMNHTDSEHFEAFVWCREKGDDWYLPAKDELKAIFNSKSKINSTLEKYGGTELSYGWHWSSTEYDKDAEFCAWGVFMNDGDTGDYDKGYNRYVRAVSAF